MVIEDCIDGDKDVIMVPCLVGVGWRYRGYVTCRPPGFSCGGWTQQTRRLPYAGLSWPTLSDAGSTLNQHWVNTSYLLDCVIIV